MYVGKEYDTSIGVVHSPRRTNDQDSSVSTVIGVALARKKIVYRACRLAQSIDLVHKQAFGKRTKRQGK